MIERFLRWLNEGGMEDRTALKRRARILEGELDRERERAAQLRRELTEKVYGPNTATVYCALIRAAVKYGLIGPKGRLRNERETLDAIRRLLDGDLSGFIVYDEGAAPFEPNLTDPLDEATP